MEIDVPNRSAARKPWPSVAAAAVLFLLLAIVLTWPLVLHLDTHIPGPIPFDNVAFLWNFWWVREVLSSPTTLFETHALFHPYGTGLAAHTHTFLNAFIGATLLSGLSIVAAQNVVIIGSLALNGFCTYLLVWRLTRHQTASLIAGLYFAASPYFAGHVLGHFNLVPAWSLPLFALLWLRALDRASYPSAIGAGVFFASVIWIDYYYGAYLLAFLVITLMVRGIAVRWRTVPTQPPHAFDRLLDALCVLLLCAVIVIRVTGGGVFDVAGIRISATTGLPPLTAVWVLIAVRLWRRWRPIPLVSRRENATPFRDLALAMVAGGVTAVGIFPVLREAARLWLDDGYVTPPGFLRSAAEGVDPIGLIAGNPFHPVWGGAVTWLYDVADINVIESTAWFGVVAIGVCVATRGFATLPPEARLWRVTALVFLIWALGPYLRLLGENTGLYLPAALLRLLPVASNLRIPGRAVVMVYLSLSVLLAYAMVAMPSLRSRTRLAAIASLILIDFAPAPPALLRLDQPAVYRALADMPSGAVLELPMGIRDGFGEDGALDHRLLFYQSIHDKPMAGGFVARMTDTLKQEHLESPLFGPLLELSSGNVPAPESLTALREDGSVLLEANGIHYVVLARTAHPLLRETVAAWPLRLVTSDDERELFEVR